MKQAVLNGSHAGACSNANFLARFETAWRSRDPLRLGAILHRDVVLIQPLMPPRKGRVQAVEGLSRFLDFVRDLEIDIHDSMRAGDRVFVEFSFRGKVGKRALQWRLTDCIRLSDGLVAERRCYFDPLPLVRAVLLQPQLWPRLLFSTWRGRARHVEG